MFGNIIRILWHSRRRYRMLIIEQMAVFIVLGICFMSLFDILWRYTGPGMLDTDDTVLFSLLIMPNTIRQNDMSEVHKAFYAVAGNARQWEQVEYAAESSNIVPYLRSSGDYMKDSVRIGNARYEVYKAFADPEIQQIFGIKIEEGTWLRSTENDSEPAVISLQFADMIGAGDSPVGLTVTDSRNRQYTVVGVFPGIKTDPFTPSGPVMICPMTDKVRGSFYKTMVFRIFPGTFSAFSSRLYKECSRLIPHFDRIDIGIHRIDEYKSKAMFPVTSRLKLMFLPTVILMLFAFTGSFGLMMLDIRRRRSEYGLRRAVGATRRSIVAMVIAQSMILTAVSSVPMIILLPAVSGFTPSCLYALLSSLCTMLFFSFISSLYPALKVSRIDPAVTLREE